MKKHLTKRNLIIALSTLLVVGLVATMVYLKQTPKLATKPVDSKQTQKVVTDKKDKSSKDKKDLEADKKKAEEEKKKAEEAKKAEAEKASEDKQESAEVASEQAIVEQSTSTPSVVVETPSYQSEPAPQPKPVEQPSEPTPVEQPIQPAPIEQPSVPEPQPEPVQPEPAPQPDGYWYEGRLISNSTPLGNSGRIWFYDTYGGTTATLSAIIDDMEAFEDENNVGLHYFAGDIRDAYTGEVIGKTVRYEIVKQL